MLDNSRRTVSERVPADRADIILRVIDEEIRHVRKEFEMRIQLRFLIKHAAEPRDSKRAYVTVDALRTRLVRAGTHLSSLPLCY
jgi:hypothetical protein